MKSNSSKTKSFRIVRLGLALAVFAGSASAQQPSAPPVRYTITDLGTLGGSFSLAYGINNRGQVDGFSTVPGDAVVHSFVIENGVTIDLATLGGPNSQSFAGLNEATQVAGTAEIPTPDPYGEDFCGLGTHLICLGFLWQNGRMTPLQTLGGNNAQASEVNDRGQVVGFAEDGNLISGCAPQALEFLPAIWTHGNIQPLPLHTGDFEGAAFWINNGGETVGASGSCGPFDPRYGLPLQPQHALLWRNGVPIDLGNLGGTQNNAAFAINDLSQIVGASDLAGDAVQHAFLWRQGAIADLGTLPGDVVSAGCAINNRGQVSGVSIDQDGNLRAFLWEDGIMHDLNDLALPGSPLYLLHGFGINDEGQLVGFAFNTDAGEVHGFLATPTNIVAAINAHSSAKIALPENVRKQLQQRVHFGRFGARLSVPQ